TSQDNTARLWHVASGEAIGDPLQHMDQVNAAAFTPDGRTVITASDDATARYWDTATGKPVMGDRSTQEILWYLRQASFRHHAGALLATCSGPLNAFPLLAASRNNWFAPNHVFRPPTPFHLHVSHGDSSMSLRREQVRPRQLSRMKGLPNTEIW